MVFSDWWEAAFSADKFTAQKGLRHVRRDYPGSYTESNFDAIFLDLANEEIHKRGELLSINEIESLAHRARIQARHYTRERGTLNPQTTQNFKEEEMVQDSMPRTTGTLSRDLYDRLDKQLQSIKTTIEPLLSDNELGTVRNMKLKTAQETILRITQEMATQAKARGTRTETQRAYQLEINRWKELASKVNARLDKRVTSVEFKDYIKDFDRSFQNTRSKA
ncbi:hypothetical protein EXS74_03520 [Candidatus Woesearchaeota archaeon]|nr:hypothetical protein [Candidatus Woesearchaeota archaeon]